MNRICPGCKRSRAETLFGSPEDPCAYCMANHVEEDNDEVPAHDPDTRPTKTRTAPLPSSSSMAAKELAARALARKHLLPFVERFNPKYDAGWVHKDICRRLEQFSADITAKKSPRLMLFMPPRHGKSTLASVAFPAWHLGLNPDHEIISCSYSGSLAMKFSRKVRAILREAQFGTLFPGCELDPDSQSAEEWLTTQGGGYVAAGVGGGITGKGAHCAYFNSLVTTKCGNKPIAEVAVGDEVLGYDHVQQRAVWARVQAVSTQYKPNDFVRVGDAILTPDHEIFTAQNDYVEVRTLLGGVSTEREGAPSGATPVQPGCEDLLFDSVREREGEHHGLWLREPESVSREHMSDVLPEGQTYTANLSAVPHRIQAEHLRGQQVRSTATSGGVLQQNVLRHPSTRTPGTHPLSGPLSNVRQGHHVREEILLEGMLSHPRSTGDSLFRHMEQVPQGSESPRAGGLCALREDQPPLGSTSHQSRGNGPRTIEPDTSMRAVPPPLSSADFGVCAEDLAELLPPAGEDSVRVVDIQTTTGNFFLENVLVHNCMVIDDPVKNRDDAESAIVQESTRDWYTSTAYTRLAPGGGILIILTRWNDNDLAGWLLSEMKEGGEQWEIVNYPAIAEQDEDYRDAGEALHPERYPLEALMRIQRAVGPRDWSALFQQNPTPASGDYFTDKMMKYYNYAELDLKSLRYYQAWDLAIGKNDRNDFTVGITVGIDRLDNIYVVDIVRGKFSGMQIVEKILDSYELWKPSMVGIEKGHIEQAIGPFLEKRVRERKLYEAFFQDLKTGRRDKEARARAIQGRLQQGKVLFPKGSPFTADLVAEMLRFPNGVHDDQVDALAWIGLMMAEFSTIGLPGKEKKASWRDQLDNIQGAKKRHRSAMSA